MINTLLELEMVWLIRTRKLVRHSSDKEYEMASQDPEAPEAPEAMHVMDCVVDIGRMAPLKEISVNGVYSEAFGPCVTVHDRNGDIWLYLMEFEAFVKAYADYVKRNPRSFDRFNYHRGLGGEVSEPLWKNAD